MHILVANDASPEALEAARFAGLLRCSISADVTLLAVVPDASEARTARDDMDGLIERVPALRNANRLVRHGHAAEQILEETERGIYDLLIIGRRGQSRIARFLLGDTALRLAVDCRIPLTVVQRVPARLRRILLCTAGGRTDHVDMVLASGMAAHEDAELTILHVMSQIDITPSDSSEQIDQPADWHIERGTQEGRHLEDLVKRAREYDVRARPLIRSGLVVAEILDEAATGDYDLIVVGAHGGQGFARFLLDDVTEAIITGVSQPVLVVR